MDYPLDKRAQHARGCMGYVVISDNFHDGISKTWSVP
jgi:hypothetical protein